MRFYPTNITDKHHDLREIVQGKWEEALQTESRENELWKELDNELEKAQGLIKGGIIDWQGKFKDNYISTISSSSSSQDDKKIEKK